MAITEQILSDMRLDLGLDNAETVFTDAELTRLYERANEDYATSVYYGFLALMANASKRYDYQAGQTNVKAGDVFDHLLRMTTMWELRAKESTETLRIVGLRPVPTLHPDYPSTLSNSDTRRRGGYWRKRRQ